MSSDGCMSMLYAMTYRRIAQVGDFQGGRYVVRKCSPTIALPGWYLGS